MREVYAYQNTASMLKISSSGGAFIGLCKAFFQLYPDGAVCGAAFCEDMTVTHQLVHSYEDCARFQGSKYVRSQCGREQQSAVCEALQKGQHVLFSGTPCQVFAMKKHAEVHGAPMDRLLTVDLICHGAPKPEVWADYLRWLENGKGRVTAYSFRYKPEGWKAYPAYAQLDNGEKLVNTARTSVYSRLHLKGYSLPKGCFTCPFSRQERAGDITIGDYWGIEEEKLSIPAKLGVSLVLLNQEAGRVLIEQIQKQSAEEGTFIRRIENERYLRYQHNLKKPTEQPAAYDAFWKDYAEHPFEWMLRKYLGYGPMYHARFAVHKMVRKTPAIALYRKLKGR